MLQRKIKKGQDMGISVAGEVSHQGGEPVSCGGDDSPGRGHGKCPGRRPRVRIVPGVNQETAGTTEAGAQWLGRIVPPASGEAGL